MNSASQSADQTKSARVDLYTDGACKGNPGPGGWGVLMRFGAHEKELYGGEAQTTNNRMEMRAVIEGLNALTRSCQVRIFTDSQYVKNGIESWLAAWKTKGRRTYYWCAQHSRIEASIWYACRPRTYIGSNRRAC